MRIGIVDSKTSVSLDAVSELLHAQGHTPLRLPLLSASELVGLQLDALLLEGDATYDSVDVCRELRGLGSRALVLLLASEFDTEQARRALGGGVDDYVVAPIKPQMVLNRLQLLALRQDAQPMNPGELTLGVLRIDPLDRVWIGERLYRVPSKEVALLRCLATMRGELVPYQRLITAAWGDLKLGSNTLEVHVSRLRRLLRQALGPGVVEIRAVRGAGYLLAG